MRLSEQEGFKAAEFQSQGWLLCSHVSEQLWEGTEARFHKHFVKAGRGQVERGLP